ncbi:DUF5819 family protein [Streptomyces meridianus]|uniref:DUF5819 family protein n=1 Tax=Streptomyces meridianus TaxID=2938945 RepID=A0ABT0X7A9_9ACTN|nr:DUF5819 family protein [Streptomyces meridianus]MCM2578412.1 DUF5819 family protein [Streptomyces meridianus]
MERHDTAAGAEPDPEVPRGVSSLSLPARAAVALAVAVVTVAVGLHLAMVFLHVAPSNTLTKRHGDRINGYVYPEFEQNWKLFAPNPLQQNITVHARAQIRTADGGLRKTGWTNLSGQDGRAILHHPLPSHTQQNELRRAWDFFTGSHDTEGQPNGLRGRLSEEYLKRIVMLRFGREHEGGKVERIQLRSVSTPIGTPPYSREKTDMKPERRVLPWWYVTDQDLPLDEARASRTAEGKAAR